MEKPIRTQNMSLVLLLVILGIISGYIYYSQIIKPDIGLISPPLAGKDDLENFKDLKLDFTLFERKEFKSTRVFGESPVSPGESGKPDLFSPFQ